MATKRNKKTNLPEILRLLKVTHKLLAIEALKFKDPLQKSRIKNAGNKIAESVVLISITNSQVAAK